MIRVKICGHTLGEDIAASVRAGADTIGVISGVPVDSPRAVDADRAAELLAGVPPFVTGVLVTMPETPDEAIDLVEHVRPDVLQIHGSFSPADFEAVREAIPQSVIKSVDATDPEEARAFDAVADALLVDSTDTSGAGGTGRTHDWERTRELVRRVDSPVILAGGLTPENVTEAIGTVSPFGVDVASGVEQPQGSRDARRDAARNDGVESDGGVKDHESVETFVARAKRAEIPEVPGR